MTCCTVGLGTSIPVLFLPCICPIFFPSILSRIKLFVIDFSRTIQARVLIFGMQVDDDLLYRGIESQSSPAYYTPSLKKWGIYWFSSVRGSVRPSVRLSV